MTDALYLMDAYLRTFDARVVSDTEHGLVLDRTAFYPAGGGQPADSGSLRGPDGVESRVVDVRKGPEGIVHVLEVPTPRSPGSSVAGAIDWELRIAHMRLHTALHILSGVVYRRFGSGITGSQIYHDRARMDLAIPGFDRAVAESLIEGVNAVVREDHPVRVRFLARADARKDPSLVRVAQELLPDVETVRLIDIEGFDVQADGGTHVAHTREVGTVRLGKIENKGSKNKRLYLTAGVSDAAAAAATTP